LARDLVEVTLFSASRFGGCCLEPLIGEAFCATQRTARQRQYSARLGGLGSTLSQGRFSYSLACARCCQPTGERFNHRIIGGQTRREVGLKLDCCLSGL
jgi:hypothetical protein